MPKKTPAYSLHKGTGQARVRIDGKDYYLGAFDSPESRERYEDLIQEWRSKQGDVSGYKLTIDELCLLFTAHAKTYYRKDGKPTSEVNNIRIALRPLIKLFGTTRAREFKPLKLKAVRNAMIDAGCVRTSINRQVDRIKRMFRWAVSEELVPSEVVTGLDCVTGLEFGRQEVEESDPVSCADEDDIEAIQPYVSRHVFAMAQIQKWTAARPGEIMQMRGRNLTMTGKTWRYEPESHKTQHRKKTRVIFIGPKAQVWLKPFLRANPDEYLFSPAESREEHLAGRRANRQTKMTPSQARRKRKPTGKLKRRPGERYTATSYRRAIANACKKAGVTSWSPGQLRHNGATAIRRQANLDAARTVLGHSTIAITEIYAEEDQRKAQRVIGKIG